MDALFDKLDGSVEAALQTLFPPAVPLDPTASSTTTSSATFTNAQQRAQEFANKVTAVHGLLAEIKAKIEEQPLINSNPEVLLEKEISDIRQDIELKTEVLEKHKQTLQTLSRKLRNIEQGNRELVAN
ncbi:hypothetical protein J3B02_001591 [Coemansia erecta]|uniref:Mediator of RNA polymerase II transcription subunit 9 n=1 Tax=Coemansia asiatica TaxID=1052880 RepID=A0A9W8CJS6_9FUNG|nr:hypothetical protein LPJ64_001654 [Coemansia asiatica]KAJ2856462.1 hypothetical protein J3B02_001591 [Coemansia erecta]